ncbi:ArsR/SmtB family transcription factor [Pseudalkalibacillus hwajinpoensis]|uniref:Winged helix-turn-helix transcriptional regulator n=1 Tax=Guptibacillus hwajinpoensis TaxID=208199 RepID=A0A4U1MHQ8_9BACL|nr:winged helix-turn-helix domain-containing protein [Pseudalkalibacillus hwajinpoensis]TKD69972.1 winged helix-turn-helix transcriptional regulator [Pseudalkalibacillus hwajinpoensis]
MSYDLKTLYSPVYELLLSFSLYSRQTFMKYLELGSKWPEKVEAFITPELKEAIKLKENLFFEDLMILLIEQSPVQNDITSFFDWLTAMSAGEIYERVAPFLDNKKTLPTDLSFQRDRSITLLKAWNEQYFQQIDHEILKHLKQDAEEKVNSIEEHTSKEIVQQASRFIIETDKITSICLIPAFHFQPMSLVDQFKDKLYITYPVKNNQLQFDSVLKMTKALGDEKRLKILQLLSKGPFTFTDIVSEIGMAKGNIHHHLSILRGVGLLNIHLFDEPNTFYYSTNKGFTSDLKSKIDLLLT